MKTGRRWSKLKKKIEELTSEDIDFKIQSNVLSFKRKHTLCNIPRYYILLNKEIIWEYPKNYDSIEWWHVMSGISCLFDEYIDTHKNELLDKCFENDITHLTDILKSADRRFGKKSLLKLREKLETPAALKILEVRLKTSFKPKPFLSSAFNKSQDSENVIGIWWYNIETEDLEYSKTAYGHLDECFTIRKLANTGITLRGRLLNIEDKLYLIVYRSIYKNISFKTLNILKSKIEKVSAPNIDYLIDDDGNIICNRGILLKRTD